MTFLRLALRNVFRNQRRSWITIAAIVAGLSSLIFLWAFIDGVNEQMIENSTRYLSGHVQLHRTGYHEEQTLDLLLDDAGRRDRELEARPEVAAVTQRLEGSALMSAGDQSRGILVVGIDADHEVQVTTLNKTLRQGRFLNASDTNAVVLGDLTASALKVGVGSEVVLVTQAADGSIGANRYQVVGIFDTRMDMIDGVYVFLPLAAAQTLYAADGRVTSLVVRLKDRAIAPAFVSRLQAASGPDVEVLGWQKLLPNVVQSVSFHEVVGYILLLVLFVVVAVGVTNTVLMAVMERTREFGVMMALGTRQSQITRMVFYEACLLGLIGMVLGSASGYAITSFYAWRGIDLSEFGKAVQTMQGLSSVIHPYPRLDRILFVSVLVILTVLATAIYPAWKAARLTPVEAIRGIRGVVVGKWRERGTTLPLFWRIAARSIVRNPRRTLLTIAATAFGLAAFVFLLSFVGGYLTQLVDNSTGYLTGHLQIQHPDFRKQLDPALSVRDPDALLARLRRQPDIAAVAPRVQAQALVSSPQQTKNFMLLGVDPVAERDVTFIDRAIKEGQALAPGDDRNIVLGRKLAEKLGVRLGEKVVVMAQAADGSLGSAAYRLTGIFATESEAFDNSIGYVTLPAAQHLLVLDQRVSTLAVKLKDRDRLAVMVPALQRQFPQYEVLAWSKILPEIEQMIGYIKVMTRIIVGIVFAVVALGVMNTLLMSVMERTREFGIMLAIGTSPAAVIRLVLYESFVLAIIGTLAGLLMGGALVTWLGTTGMDLSRYTRGLATIPGMTSVIYPRLSSGSVVQPILALLFVSMLAAIYPAWRAARLDPVKAIRHG